MEIIKFFNEKCRAEISQRSEADLVRYPKCKFQAKIYQLTPKGKYQKEKLVVNYVYPSLEQAQEYTYNYLKRVSDNIQYRKSQTLKRRQENKEVESSEFYKVGDIVVNSWGYEQTNIEFYVVQSITAKTIKVQEVGQIRSNYYSHGMACEVAPDVNKLLNKEYTLKVKAKGVLSNPKSYYYFHKWSGQSQYASWRA